MATYWIDQAGGDDANDGLSFANAKQNWKAGIDAARLAGTGNTVNVVGTVEIPVAGGATLSGFTTATNYDSNFGIRIQGTDAAGDPATATVTFADSATATTALTLSSNANFIDIKGLYVDWSGNAVAALSKHFCIVSSTAANGVRFTDCVFERGPEAYGVALSFSALTSDDTVMRYCVFIENGNPSASPALLNLDDRGQLDLHHCVFIVNGTIVGNYLSVNLGSNDANLTDHAVTFNTFYLHSDVVIAGGTLGIIGSTDASPFSGTPIKEFRNNVAYWGSNIGVNGKRFASGNSSNSSANYDLSMGYNLFADEGANSYAAGQPYQVPWDPDDDDSPEGTSIWTGDEEITADPFFDLGATYAWAMSGNGYSFTLPYDLRIVDPYRDNSSLGGVPGAIVDAVAVPDPQDIVVSPASYDFGSVIKDTTEFATITITNIGDVDLVVASSILTGSAAMVIESTPTSGTLSTGEEISLTINFSPTTFGSHTGTLTISSDDPDEPSVIVILTGICVSTPKVPRPRPNPEPIAPIGPDSPAFLDPMDRGTGISLAMRVHRNTTMEQQYKVEGPTGAVTAIVSGFVELATATPLTAVPGLALTGLTVLMLESDAPVVVQINSYTFSLLANSCWVAGGADITTFKLQNDSLVREATIRYFGAK